MKYYYKPGTKEHAEFIECEAEGEWQCYGDGNDFQAEETFEEIAESAAYNWYKNGDHNWQEGEVMDFFIFDKDKVYMGKCYIDFTIDPKFVNYPFFKIHEIKEE